MKSPVTAPQTTPADSTILWNNGDKWRSTEVRNHFIALSRAEVEQMGEGSSQTVWADISLFDGKPHNAEGVMSVTVESVKKDGQKLKIRISATAGCPTITFEVPSPSSSHKLFKERDPGRLPHLIRQNPNCQRTPESLTV